MSTVAERTQNGRQRNKHGKRHTDRGDSAAEADWSSFVKEDLLPSFGCSLDIKSLKQNRKTLFAKYASIRCFGLTGDVLTGDPRRPVSVVLTTAVKTRRR